MIRIQLPFRTEVLIPEGGGTPQDRAVIRLSLSLFCAHCKRTFPYQADVGLVGYDLSRGFERVSLIEKLLEPLNPDLGQFSCAACLHNMSVRSDDFDRLKGFLNRTVTVGWIGDRIGASDRARTG